MGARGKRLGDRGEAAALALYRRRGFRLLASNWRSRLGELDLVLRRGDLVVFCEVKTRSSPAAGPPHESVTGAKQRKVRALASAFLTATGISARAYRFDVASVWVGPRGRPAVHLFEDAF